MIPAPFRPLDKSAFLFTLLLGAISALPPFGIDMALPALPLIAGNLQATLAAAGWTLSTFLCGFAFAPMVLGPVSDRYGRRIVLLGGILLFTLGGILCAVSLAIEWLLAARFLQGMGAGAGAVLPIAIVRDLYEGQEARVKLSYVTLVLGLAPVVAPAVGTLLLSLGGWRFIYGTLSVFGAGLFIIVLLFFGESRKKIISPPQLPVIQQNLVLKMLANYRHVLRQGPVVGYILQNGLAFSCMFAFISGSPLVFIKQYGFGQGQFAALFAGVACGTILGSMLNARLSRAGYGSGTLLRLGMLIALLANLVLLIACIVSKGLIPLWLVLPCLVLSNGSYGIIGPNASLEAMRPLPELAGVVAALLRSAQMAMGALTSVMVAALFMHAGIIAMTGCMTACAVAMCIIAFMMRHHLAQVVAIPSPRSVSGQKV